MTDLLYRPAAAKMPGLAGLPVPKVSEAYETGCLLALVFLLSGLVALGVFFLEVIINWVWCRGRETEHLLGGGSKHWASRLLIPPIKLLLAPERLLIAPWILKDIFWTLEIPMPVFVFGIVALLLCTVRFLRWPSTPAMAQLLWVLGNCAWADSELMAPR